jgi:ankyrin repeat protein
LHAAASEGQNEIAELLIAEGADVKNDEGETPIDMAIRWKRTRNSPPPTQTRRQDGCRIES